MTFRDNSGQIAAGRPDCLHFDRAGAPLGNSFYVLLIAAFASEGDRDRPQVCWGRRRRFRRHAGRRGVIIARPGGLGRANTEPDPDPHPDARAHEYRHRSVGRRGRGKSRQQFPGAAWKPGVIRFRPGRCGTTRVAAALPKRRTSSGSGPGVRPTESRSGTARRPISSATGARPGAASRGSARALRRASMSACRSTKAAARSTFPWHCSRRPLISPSSASTLRSTRGRGPGPSRWSMDSERSIRAGTPGWAPQVQATTPRSTAR